MLLIVLAVVAAVLGCVGIAVDARMVRNGVWLTLAVVLGVVGGLWELARVSPVGTALLVALAVLVPVAVLVFGVGLVANGVQMLRREGRSLGNLLSLLAGVLVLVLPLVGAALATWTGTPGVLMATGIAFVSGYLSIAFVCFAVYSVVYGAVRRRIVPVAVVVHGAGLRADGSVTPLLRGRLDRGIRAFRQATAAGARPVLVASGGKGDDEVRAEGEAMAEYLVEQGIPAETVLAETSSRTTDENIRNTVALVGSPGPYLLVTSDYHVLRTATLARRAGIDAQVVGSRTARYYVPSAFIREFVAVLVAHRWLTLTMTVPFVVLTLGLASVAAVVGGR